MKDYGKTLCQPPKMPYLCSREIKKREFINNLYHP